MASAVPVTAQMVGQAFVSQYYSVLHHWPHMVYRFYTDASRLTRAESGPDGAVLSARSQMDIHNVVMSMGQEYKAEILSVDSSESFGGSVLVLVTGIMCRHGSRRAFVQTFFLAPQERGYYVLNDVFRYLDDEPKIMAQQMAVNGSFQMLDRLHISSDAGCVARNFSSSATGKDATASVPLSDYVNHVAMAKNEQVVVKGNVPHQQTVDPMPIEKLSSTEQLSAVDDTRACFDDGSTEKKSYASILRHQREGGKNAAVPISYQQATSEQLQADFGHQQNGMHLLENPVIEESTNSNCGLGEIQSVYIKNLPANITESQIEDDLMKIGTSRPSSVVLKNYKDGGVYAFVEFDDPESGRKAIEASPVPIGGKKAHIEERRSTYTGGRGRSRASGRGSSNSGSRGRGAYNVNARSSRTHNDSDASSRGGVRDVQGNLNKD